MIYTYKTKRAIKLCFKAHAGQVDKSGLPYVHHPLHLAEQMDDELSTIVALLHDVIEDTTYSFEGLEHMGFGNDVIEALRLLTHDTEVPYLDYVKKIATNPTARKVKLADLAHNSDITRLDHEPTERDLMRLEKYREARRILLETSTNDSAILETHGNRKMSSINILLIGITDLDTDCIVNAANRQLAQGSGVCGAIFHAAGARELRAACDKIGGCPTGGAVITPGFALKAKYVIHAVGPVWQGGNNHEPQDLYSCYRESLYRAKENDCHSIGFPLISSGIFGYPKDKAWMKALQSCNDWLTENADYDMDIIFAVLDQRILELGIQTMEEVGINDSF